MTLTLVPCNTHTSITSITHACFSYWASWVIMTAVCYVTWIMMLTANIAYREKTKRHYFSTDLLVGQDFHLHLCSPLPTCFIHWPVCSLEPLWISNSCGISHDTIYYFLAVWHTTRRPNPSKINCLLDGNCHLLFNWSHVSNLWHLRHKQRHRST